MPYLLEIGNNTDHGYVVSEYENFKLRTLAERIYGTGHTGLGEPGAPPTRLRGDLLKDITKRVVLHYDKQNRKDDIIQWGGGFIVNEKVKDKIDSLEPGLHDFFPVEVVQEKTGYDYGPHFIMAVYERPDIIDFDRTIFSNPGFSNSSGIEYAAQERVDLFKAYVVGDPDWYLSSGRPFVTFKPGGCDGRHVWRGCMGYDLQYLETTKLNNGEIYFHDKLAKHIFVSDELGDWMKEENILGQVPIPINEGKDYQWYLEQKAKGFFEKVKDDEWIT